MTSKSSSSSSETSSSKESASSYSKSKSSSGGRPRSAAEIRQAAYRSLQKTSLTSHAGYSAKPIDAVAKSFQTDPDNVALVLGFIFLVLHLLTPTFLLPHLSALVTLIIPLQDTLLSLSYEISRNPGAGRDTCQWLAYWVVYVAFEMARGWVAVWRPGWKGAFEVGRSAGLVTVGGPWFSRDVLVSEVELI